MTPPSAKDYAKEVVAAVYDGKKHRRLMLPSQVETLVRMAYDAGVLAQQRFTETPKG